MVSEHEFIVRVLKRFHRNVYCGIYRLKLYKYLLGICKDKQNFEQSELLFFKRLCESNIHDYSAFWYRFNLVKESIHGLKESELQWVDQLIKTYETMYSQSEESSKLYTLRTYRQWLLKYLKDSKTK
jgi:hypothetical protein